MNTQLIESESGVESIKPETLSFTMMRFGKLAQMDRSFDIEYWQRLGDAAIFNAGWELAEQYHRAQGATEDELRLQRTVEHFQRQRG